jgi:hypothetical protein
MDAALIRLVWRRARRSCEYCQMPQAYDEATFEIDHIISRKHGGPTRAINLCLSCLSCNSFKGSDIAGRDKRTRKLAPLFNPRRHAWSRHFHWEGAVLVGRTAIGRVTIAVLHMNHPLRIELRQRLIEEGLFPPTLAVR